MHRLRRGCGCAGALALGVILLAGCGRSLLGSNQPTDTPGGTGSGALAPGQVTIAADQQRYAPVDTITVTIANGLANSILAADHQSNCTTVSLERQVAAAWQPQNPCQLMIATRLVSFGAETVTLVQLTPRAPAGGTPPAWEPGTYRVAFTYQTSAMAAGPTVYSASLTVG